MTPGLLVIASEAAEAFRRRPAREMPGLDGFERSLADRPVPEKALVRLEIRSYGWEDRQPPVALIRMESLVRFQLAPRRPPSGGLVGPTAGIRSDDRPPADDAWTASR